MHTLAHRQTHKRIHGPIRLSAASGPVSPSRDSTTVFASHWICSLSAETPESSYFLRGGRFVQARPGCISRWHNRKTQSPPPRCLKPSRDRLGNESIAHAKNGSEIQASICCCWHCFQEWAQHRACAWASPVSDLFHRKKVINTASTFIIIIITIIT